MVATRQEANNLSAPGKSRQALMSVAMYKSIKIMTQRSAAICFGVLFLLFFILITMPFSQSVLGTEPGICFYYMPVPGRFQERKFRPFRESGSERKD